jgi:hypothetical protein
MAIFQYRCSACLAWPASCPGVAVRRDETRRAVRIYFSKFLIHALFVRIIITLPPTPNSSFR